MSEIADSAELTVGQTLRRGFQLSPEMARGLTITLALAVVAAAGRVVVPLTIQTVIDDGILSEHGPQAGVVARTLLVAALAMLSAAACSALVNIRLVRRTEAGLATLRVKAFRHVHDLATLTQNTERRGSLVSRVTNDVDTISMFVQWGGIMLLVASLQIVVSTVIMTFFSWQLTLVVWAAYVPLWLIVRNGQRPVSRRFAQVRERVGHMLGTISEAVVGAETVSAYGIQRRTAGRIEAAVEETRVVQGRALVLVSTIFSAGTLMVNLALAIVIVVGAWLGVAGNISAGQVVAFLFLVQLFGGPVQMATEVLNEMQNALAGWRRVIAVVDAPIEVADAADASDSPRGSAAVSFRDVRFSYPDGPEVLHGISFDLPARSKVAVVGETGSGKTTVAKLVTRLIDPSSGQVLLDGADLRELTLASLRHRVVLVPQEGFLFAGTILDNAAYGLRGERSASEAEALVQAAFETLGLADWLADLPQGLLTEVGQRGEALSAGERQLVAIARAYLAEPDLLVLDEATSAVDPATEVRIARALDSLTTGRSTITIAHRLSTAEASDLVMVIDQGNLCEFGPHHELVGAGGVYSKMHAAWVAQTR
ncbi:MAG: ABC transporter ATP-binding protein/permease [Promicromonosporaceae bacterium]|nr:ABC transporter ATP-binding protein/permease [Promicromonosporaceae bacterium]